MAIADRVYWLHAITPLHVGAGRGNGYIDLPVIREKVTGFPFVPGSSTKGVFADFNQATDDARDPEKPEGVYRKLVHAAFGRAGEDTANSGALSFTDARLVCLPVRSLYGTFAWCTCPMILQRLKRDLELTGVENLDDVGSLTNQAHNPVGSTGLLQGGKAYIEDLDITVQGCNIAAAWAKTISEFVFADVAWREIFKERFLVLPDNIFAFLAETGTEVQAHICIDPDYKRVKNGALWYEESLPAESILAGLVQCAGPYGVTGVSKAEVLSLLDHDQVLQMGGKATTGKGQVRMMFRKGAET